MKKKNIVRAWRDRDAFLSMSDDERAQMPENPAGITDLRTEDLDGVTGAAAGTHYSHCEPTASWCDDCGVVSEIRFR